MMNPDKIEKGLEDSRFYRTKKFLDKLLPAVLLALIIYLYLEFLTGSSSTLHYYRIPLQYLILAYFVSEILVDFMLYEEKKEFLRDKWLDIILTMPFFTAFKGLKVLKVVKSFKPIKGVKLGKVLKTGKVGQKMGKLVTKGKKLRRKHF
jgi:hypothetical protein